ncbi:MAG: hypothetical protein JW727_01255 [Candidatus Aenigmarchaeota archaeon]|nr:hypothetical protein [Candidatus Aenigmarchaeota archaeon]
MKNTWLIFSLLLVVSLSGCTNSDSDGGAGGGTGLSIDYVRPSYNYVMSGDSISIEAQATNLGDRKIDHVVAKPIYLPWDGFNQERTCDELYPPKSDLERQGQPCYVSWRGIRVPKVQTQETFPVGVRFYYDYSTETSAQVFAISARQFAGLKERGEVPMAKTISNTNGPIQVSVSIDSVIIIPTSGTKRVPVNLKFTNAASGYPQSFDGDARSYQIDSVEVNLERSGGMRIDDLGNCGSEIPMRGGASGDCIFWLEVPSSTTDEIVADIRIVSKYSYAIEEKQTITVNPSLEDDE